MNVKTRAHHRRYLQALRSLTPEARLRKAFELSDFSKQLFVAGLRRRFPSLPEAEFRQLVRDRVDKCRNRNY